MIREYEVTMETPYNGHDQPRQFTVKVAAYTAEDAIAQANLEHAQPFYQSGLDSHGRPISRTLRNTARSVRPAPAVIDGSERRAEPREDMRNPLRLDDLPPTPTSPEKA